MRAPLVGVIVPTRDRQQLVSGAIRSALSQQSADIEVCVVDDGSDPPVELSPDLRADERVRQFRLDRVKGVAAARNLALRATTAEFIAFLDDDDVWLPGKIERQVAVIQSRGPQTVMVACGFEVWEGRRLVASFVPPDGVNSGALLAHPCLWPSTVLLRRSALEQAGGFDESLERVEDWDLWLRIAELGEIAVIPEVLVDRRWTPLPPSTARGARAIIASRLEARRRLLPGDRANALRSSWHCDEAVLLARLGERRAAWRMLLKAWRECPGAPQPLRGLVRLCTGERAWALLRRLAPRRAMVRRRARRPPGPAPAWDGR